jgi:hypothetical protein
VSVRLDGAIENLRAKAWFALAILAVVMGLLLFVPAWTFTIGKHGCICRSSWVPQP